LPEIQNPNLQAQGSGGSGGGGDMRSTITFTMLALAALLGYQYFFKPNAQQAPQQQQAQQQQAQQQQTAATQQATAPTAAIAQAQQASATPVIAAQVESDITVENDLFKIVFTNRGAQVKHWILKQYNDTAGKPLDLVQPQTSEKFGYPLALYTYEPKLTSQLNNALYQVTVEGAQPSATGLVVAPAAITYHYAANGLDVQKTFRFDSTYVVGIEAQVKRNGAPVRSLVEWPSALGDMEEFLPSSSTRSTIKTSATSYFAWALNGKTDSTIAKKVSGNATTDAPYSYAAVMDLYFAAAFLPDDPAGTTVVTLHNAINVPKNLRKDSCGRCGRCGWRPEWRHASAPVCRPQGNRHSQVGTRHRRRRQGGRAVARAADSVWILDIYRQAALHCAALPGDAWNRQLGMGHHPVHGGLYRAAAAHALHDDEVVAENDAHSAQN
jgi:YidC/Oxa1 family membrane protein insertase